MLTMQIRFSIPHQHPKCQKQYFSALLSFIERILKNDVYWNNRSHVEVTDVLPVKVLFSLF